jgi:hypothetical protein
MKSVEKVSYQLNVLRITVGSSVLLDECVSNPIFDIATSVDGNIYDLEINNNIAFALDGVSNTCYFWWTVDDSSLT